MSDGRRLKALEDKKARLRTPLAEQMIPRPTVTVKVGRLFSIFTKGIEATGLETLEHSMKSIAYLTAAAAAIAGGILYIAFASEQTDGDASPIYE